MKDISSIFRLFQKPYVRRPAKPAVQGSVIATNSGVESSPSLENANGASKAAIEMWGLMEQSIVALETQGMLHSTCFHTN